MKNTHKVFTAVLGITFLIPASPAKAQTALQRRSTAAPQYVLGPGDQIVLHISDMEEVSDKPIFIDPSGYIDLPMAGRIQADGLTLAELKAAIAVKLSPYFTQPEVSINLALSGSQPVSVIGQVNNPGVHQLSGSRRLLEVISLSGGLKSDAGPVVIITRDPRYGGIDSSSAKIDPVSGYSKATFSLDALLSSAAPEDNILMEPNDVVSIPRAELVYVMGEVKRAGGFPLSTHPTISLMQALSLAGDVGPDSSAAHARILRQVAGGDGTLREIPVDIKKIAAGKAPDVQLIANDVLFVPHSGVKATSRRAIDVALGISTSLLIYR